MYPYLCTPTYVPLLMYPYLAYPPIQILTPLLNYIELSVPKVPPPIKKNYIFFVRKNKRFNIFILY